MTNNYDPEVKRYQRQKLIAGIAAILLSLTALILMAFFGGPCLDQWVRHWPGLANNRWSRLIVLGFLTPLAWNC